MQNQSLTYGYSVMYMNIISKNYKLIIKSIFCLSLPFITLILSIRANGDIYEPVDNIEIIISCLLSFVVGIILSIKFDCLKFIRNNFKYSYLVLSIFISFYLESVFLNYGESVLLKISVILKELGGRFLDNIDIIYCLFMFPAMFILVYLFVSWIIPKIINFICNMSKFERKFIVIYAIIGLILIGVIYNLTDCFYSALDANGNKTVDVIYTTDSSNLFMKNAFLNINMYENDLRQPLFGVFSLPIGLVADFFGNLLFFIPNSGAIVLAFVQFVLLGVSLILLMRMLDINDNKKMFFIVMVLSSYTYVLFSFVIEQYIISLFWLILAIYVGYNNFQKINYYYIGAVGTLITSGIIFPVISKFKNFKYWIKNVISCFCVFVSIVIVSGRLPIFISFLDTFNYFSSFIGKTLSFSDKFCQFSHFVRNLFFAPDYVIGSYRGFQVFWLKYITDISVLGIIILLVCFIGFLLNRKLKIAKISFAWVVFSFVVLCLVGWGTKENGLILYSLYFSWAYLVLVYLFIDKIFKNIKIKFCVILGISAIMIYFNLIGFLEILEFGIKYYS